MTLHLVQSILLDKVGIFLPHYYIVLYCNNSTCTDYQLRYQSCFLQDIWCSIQNLQCSRSTQLDIHTAPLHEGQHLFQEDKLCRQLLRYKDEYLSDILCIALNQRGRYRILLCMVSNDYLQRIHRPHMADSH